jgi:hypothetical protein
MPKVLKGVAALVLSATGAAGTASAQPQAAYSLAARSSIVVSGTVRRASASLEPMVRASPQTVVIAIDHMYAGSEIAGDQSGHLATVILSKPMALRPGAKAIFFGEPRFIGSEMTIADAGEVSLQAAGRAELIQPLGAGVQARRDAPIRERLALATFVARGTVERVEPVRERTLTDEHDPEFTLAFVRITERLSGADQRPIVPILFAASRDIVWFNSPKLRPGEDAIFIAHAPQPSDLAMLRSSPAFELVRRSGALLVTQPYDVLPASEERRVANLVAGREVR